MDIIKTWPAAISPKTVAEMFSPTVPPFHRYYFTLGRNLPKQPVERLWFTYRGRILGSFKIEEFIVNDGSLPRLKRLDGGESEWQFVKDARIAVCSVPCERNNERLAYEGFRGWRYFDLEAYRPWGKRPAL